MKAFKGLSNWIGVDLGSSQIRIYKENKMILAESSTVAVDSMDGHIMGFGTDAMIRYHQAPGNVSLEWPVQNGMIADYEMAKAMLRFFIRKSLHRSVSRPTVMIAIPGEVSSVTRHALVDALIHAGAQQVYLISSPAAAAIGAGRELQRPSVLFSLVMGRDVTDAGLYSCGGVVGKGTIPFGGHHIDIGICRYMQERYRMLIGITQAEKLKSEMISLDAAVDRPSFTIRGRRLQDGVEVVVELTLEEMRPVLHRVLQPLLRLIRQVLRQASPDMAGDLLKNGILLSGGSALLDGLAGWLSAELSMPVTVAERPGDVSALGCYRALEVYQTLPLLVENGEKYYGGT